MNSEARSFEKQIVDDDGSAGAADNVHVVNRSYASQAFGKQIVDDDPRC